MRLKQRLACICASLVVLLLIVQECDAIKSRGSSKTSSGRRGSSNTGSSSSGGWFSSGSKTNSQSTSHKKPEPSAPRLEQSKPVGSNYQGTGGASAQSKPIGWNVPGHNNPGAPPAYSNTHTKGLSNPSGGVNPPPYSKNSPPGHQTIQANTANQYQGMNYPRQTGSAGYPGGSYPNQGAHYPGINPNQGAHYPGINPNQGAHYPGINPNQGGHYPGMNYGAGGYGGGHSGYGGSYPSHSGYSPAAPNGVFASGYPVVNNYYGSGGGGYGGGLQRSSSGNTLTNTLLAGSLGLGLYNAIRPYPSYSSGYGGGYGAGLAGGGSTVHHHYYNNQAAGAGANPNTNTNPNQSPDPVVSSNQNTNAVQPAAAPLPQGPVVQNGSVDTSAGLVTPPPPALAPDNQITDLDCVYAMKILNCSEIQQCPQEWLHPSCLNRTISKEYFDSITLPPPPPIPEAQPQQNGTMLEKTSVSSDQMSPGQDKSLYSSNSQQYPVVYPSNGQQLPVVSSSSDKQLPSASSSSAAMDYSLCLTIFLAVPALMNKFEFYV